MTRTTSNRTMAALLLVGLVWVGACAHSPYPLAVPQYDPGYAATYSESAVVADHPLASQAGARMLAAGGNAVDAAVAASFCLSVVRPFSCGIGGGGFMLISLPPSQADSGGQAIALDYRETCPAAVGPDYYLDKPNTNSRLGARASGVPGTVAGLLYALETYGSLDRAVVLAPAIEAARRGFVADAAHVNAAGDMTTVWQEHPELRDSMGEAYARFAREGQIAVGDLVVNEPHALALELIARDGAQAFYRGPIADAIMIAMDRDDGPMTKADLGSFTVRDRAALASEVGSWQVLSMPPPSSGGVATQQVFGLLERLGGLDGNIDQDSAQWRHMLIESFKHAFADRARWLADDTFTPVPLDQLTSPAYLDSLAARFDPTTTLPNEQYGTAPQLPGDSGTSHISVIDADGMAVGCTETINLYWGSCAEVPGFGFLLNDQMDDFTTSDAANAYGLIQSDRNRPGPGKRPLSSMTPTIVLENGHPVAVAGASGGPRIITGTLQVLLSGLVFGDDAGQAVVRPRLHHQWQPDEVRVETAWQDTEVLDQLRDRGHKTVWYGKAVGVVQVIFVQDGRITAASDPRKGGRPAGY
ncbi:MAG: gamma-glutamyltransferase [Candidatus Krumholzibacteria bacterium]|nr:gamma-glutamyltransferase [Candidatus Krumholzibacteria bacterium]